MPWKFICSSSRMKWLFHRNCSWNSSRSPSLIHNLYGNSWAGIEPQDGREKPLCATARSSNMIWLLLYFFPECEHRKGYFWESRSCVFGGCFPSGCLHPISSSPDLCQGWEGGSESQGLWALSWAFPKAKVHPRQPGWRLHEDMCSFDGDLRIWRHIPHPCRCSKSLCWEQKRQTLWWNRQGVREQIRAILCLPVSNRVGNPSFTFPKCTVPFWKGLKTQNAAALSKTCIVTEGLHAIVEKSVGVPKWGGIFAL